MTDQLPAPRAVLLDLEGTLYANDEALPGAAEAITRLRGLGLGLRFVTNTDSKTTARIAADLARYGLDIDENELFTPVVAAQRLFAAPGTRPYTLLSDALSPLFPVNGGGSEGASGGEEFTHVLVGDCRDTLDYPRLDEAFRALRAGAHLVALQRGRYFKRADGDHVDTGAIVAALEYAAGVTARVLGKPATDFFTLAADSLGVPVASCLAVGDDATTDITGGLRAGLRTVQVRTGKYADQHVEGVTGQAHHTLASVADLPALLSTLTTA